MTAPALGAALTTVLRSCMDDLEDLNSELLERLPAELSDPDLVPPADLADATAFLHFGIYRNLLDHMPLDQDFVRALGRRRANQGVPLPTQLHAFRIGFRFVWETLAGRVDLSDRLAARQLLDHVDRFWALLDQCSTALRLGYADAEIRRGRLLAAERDRHLDVLLGLRPADATQIQASAEALGLPRRGQFHVLVTDRDNAGWADQLRRVVDELVVYIVGRALPADPPTRAGLSPMFDDVAAAGEHRHRAVMALRSLPAGEDGVRRYGDHPLATLVASASQTAQELADAVLGPILRLPAAERIILLTTLRAWFTAAGSTDATARALYCHRNTVRYRLRRIETLTGRQITDPRDTADLYLAVEVLSQQAHAPV
jgi:hypothetical protein